VLDLSDKDEYPQTAMIEEHCINMVARLFHAPTAGKAVGASAIGSNEAIEIRSLIRRSLARRPILNLEYHKPPCRQS